MFYAIPGFSGFLVVKILTPTEEIFLAYGRIGKGGFGGHAGGVKKMVPPKG